MVWPCKLSGVTHTMAGKRRTVNATIDGAGDVVGAVYEYMSKRRSAWEWYGEEVTAVTPLGQRVHVMIERQDAAQILYSGDEVQS